MRVPSRYLVPILVAAVVVLTSVALEGCSQSQEPSATLAEDSARWTEKQVIEHLYGYLMDKAGQLQSARAEGEKVIIDWGFTNAIMKARREALEEDDLSDLGQWVEMEFNEPLGTLQKPSRPPIWTGALKRLATYNGNGSWSVSTNDWEWLVDERTGEVIAENEEAAELLEEITHETYHHGIYNYHIDYPASWTVTQIGDEAKVLIICPEPQVDIAIDRPRKLQTGQSLGECASGFAAFLSTLDQDFELVSLVKLADGNYQMEFEWIVGGTTIHSRTYFVLHNSWVYIIAGSAPKSTHKSYLGEFDYAYNSFGFD